MLLAGVDEVIGVIFVLITLLGGLINWIGQQKEAPPVPPKRRESERKREAATSNVFDEGDSRKKRKERPAGNRPSPPPVPKPKRERLVEVVESSNDSTGSFPHRLPGGDIAARSEMGSRDLGGGVRTHVAQAMGARVGKEVEQHIGHSVNQSVAEHLGASSLTTGVAAKPAQSAPRHPLLQGLSDGESLRQAFVLNLILQRPASLLHRLGASPADNASSPGQSGGA